MTLPEEDRYLLQKSYVKDELVKMLGGRVAEDISLVRYQVELLTI